jgi:hypothetical protein
MDARAHGAFGSVEVEAGGVQGLAGVGGVCHEEAGCVEEGCEAEGCEPQAGVWLGGFVPSGSNGLREFIQGSPIGSGSGW